MHPKNKILLMGNPNVGKSVFFSELTGTHATSSNYAGTTVGYMKGVCALGGEQYTVIDVPGTYSLTATSEAEAVAARFMESGADAIICVLDATNLERNLCLALEIKKYNIPTVYALNLADVAERRGIGVNTGLLARKLNAPVVVTIAVKKKGIDELKKQLEVVLHSPEKQLPSKNNTPTCGGRCTSCSVRKSCSSSDTTFPLYSNKKNETTPPCSKDTSGFEATFPPNSLRGKGAAPPPWATAKEISRQVIIKNPAAKNFLDKLGDSMMQPFPGIPIAFLVIMLVIAVVVGGGEALIQGVLEPLVDNAIVPFFRSLFSFVPDGVVKNILLGEFGIFVISFEWIIALILPYVFLFYVASSFLEDSGYLPRLSVLFDNIMRKLGMQGGSLIHIFMGLGCAVPAIIGSRAATTRKERIVVAAAVCFAVPCISQTGAIIALLSNYSWWLFVAMLAFTLVWLFVAAFLAGKAVKGKVEPLLLEIPNLLIPEPKAYTRKLLTRMKHFLLEAEIPMLLAIVAAALLKESGLLDTIAVYAQPLVSEWLGLPPDAVIGLILGIIRREMSVAPLLELELNHLQAFVGGVVSLMYLPCLSVFGILTREFKLKVAAVIMLSTIFSAFFVGGVINQVAGLFL
ncbi:MAG: ferrous iron transport protein B [Defluviitaleaceae bacterium]|nr:ferrous iron transport protein B [Defluviitaleaceae bacterium]